MSSAIPKIELKPGAIIPSFELAAANRSNHVSPSDFFKQQKNLLLVFFHGNDCDACRDLLRRLAEHDGEYQRLNTEVLAIAREDIAVLRRLGDEMRIWFPLLSDPGSNAFQRYLGHQGTGVFIADRQGRLYLAISAGDADDLPAESEVRDWLEFI